MTSIHRWASALAILGALGLLTGCPAEKEKDGEKPGKDSVSKEKEKKGKEKGKHDHADHGPHGGPLADWDDKYHAEFTVDHKKKQARVYILGPDAKTPAPIKADKVTLSMRKPKFQLDLKPEKQKGDPEGTASVFVGTHKDLAKERDFEGTLSALIDGKPYADEFKGHGHSHDK